MKNCLIISGGAFSPVPDTLKYDFCIACDKGYLYAEKMGIRPDLIVGDFDSYKDTLPDDIPCLTFPVEKDDPDTMLAVKEALKRGAETITLCCALGNRFDHTFSNIQTLHYIAARGARGVIVSAREWMTTITKDTPAVLEKRAGFSLSVFSLTDRSEGVAIEGAKYTGDGITLTGDFPLGESNKWAEKNARISVERGILLAVESAEAGL